MSPTAGYYRKHYEEYESVIISRIRAETAILKAGAAMGRLPP
jgi:hypothetical protein